jgi:RimJ/RimL family protein N-acetyltransferase
MIETERLLLRNWREEDICAFVEQSSTPAVMRWLGGVRPQGFGMRRRVDLDYFDPEWGDKLIIIYRIERQEWLARRS